jgi:hypothetical protein
MAKVTLKIDKTLHRRAAEAAANAGYSSTEEFIGHLIEKELARTKPSSGPSIVEQLKGLGCLS